MSGRCDRWVMTIPNERVEGQPAFVLHSRPYRETSALVDFFTEDHGRLCLLVKGVRQAKSRLRLATQSFSPLQIGWTGRSELKTLTGAEAQGYYPQLQGRALCCGLYLNELLVRLLPVHDAAPRLYAVYRLAIQSIADPDMEEPMLRVFEHRLLDELGIAPSFTHDQSTQQPIEADAFYIWEAQQGLIMHPDQTRQSGYLGAHLQAMAVDDYSDVTVRKSAKRLMRLLLQQQLGDKPLASRALFSAGSAPTMQLPSQ